MSRTGRSPWARPRPASRSRSMRSPGPSRLALPELTRWSIPRIPRIDHPRPAPCGDGRCAGNLAADRLGRSPRRGRPPPARRRRWSRPGVRRRPRRPPNVRPPGADPAQQLTDRPTPACRAACPPPPRRRPRRSRSTAPRRRGRRSRGWLPVPLTPQGIVGHQVGAAGQHRSRDRGSGKPTASSASPRTQPRSCSQATRDDAVCGVVADGGRSRAIPNQSI